MTNFSVWSRSRLFLPGAGADPSKSEPESAPGPWPSGAGAGAGAAQKSGGSATLQGTVATLEQKLSGAQKNLRRIQ